KQYKVNIGVKVYPSQWNKRKQIATICIGISTLSPLPEYIEIKLCYIIKTSYLCTVFSRILRLSSK
ncbi:hypothetical protein AAH064_17565, partial [Bacteroides uniformis]